MNDYILTVTYNINNIDNAKNLDVNKNNENKSSNIINNSSSLEHDKVLESLNKTKIKSIMDKAPKREKSNLNDFINYFKNNTKGLNEFEKAYSLFYWIFKHISYGNYTLRLNDFQKIYNAKEINISISQFYSHILQKIGLNVINIEGFNKDLGSYKQGNIILGNNSSWNILEIKGNYYLIDPSFHFTNCGTIGGFGIFFVQSQKSLSFPIYQNHQNGNY